MTEIAGGPEFGSQIVSMIDTEAFDRGGFNGNVYIPKTAAIGFTALMVQVLTEHPRKRMGETTTRNYLVIQGRGEFDLDGELRAVKPGDLVTIMPGGEYSYRAIDDPMSMFEFNVSPDNSFTDTVIE